MSFREFNAEEFAKFVHTHVSFYETSAADKKDYPEVNVAVVNVASEHKVARAAAPNAAASRAHTTSSGGGRPAPLYASNPPTPPGATTGLVEMAPPPQPRRSIVGKFVQGLRSVGGVFSSRKSKTNEG